MKERAWIREASILGVALALGGSACGGGHAKIEQPTRARYDGLNIQIEVAYNSDGSRILKPSHPELSPILQWCDGGNLIQQTLIRSNGSSSFGDAAPTSVIAGDPKCEDGRLTKSEFSTGTSAIEIPQG